MKTNYDINHRYDMLQTTDIDKLNKFVAITSGSDISATCLVQVKQPPQ